MILDAAQKYSIDIQNSFAVGDKWSDIIAGKVAGCKTVLVLTGHGNGEYQNTGGSADYIATDLFDVVNNYILRAEHNAEGRFNEWYRFNE